MSVQGIRPNAHRTRENRPAGGRVVLQGPGDAPAPVSGNFLEGTRPDSWERPRRSDSRAEDGEVLRPRRVRGGGPRDGAARRRRAVLGKPEGGAPVSDRLD